MTFASRWSACPVMTAEEIQNLEDALLFHRSADLERKVRDMAALCAESCLASGKPWRCHFLENGAARGANPSVLRTVEITVDVRGVKEPYAATLIAEEQIRRQLAKYDWAKLPDLGGDA